MKLTPEQEAHKELIEITRREIASQNDVLNDLIRQCKHVFPELTPTQLDDKWLSVGARCMICGSRFGWRCKNSPDGACHYFSENGQVELLDGTLVPVPKGHDVKHESDDWCIFCRMPEERN